MGRHMDAQVGTQADAQMEAWVWVRHLAGQPALPHPNPISSRLLVRVSKIPRRTVPHPALVALAQQVHQHPQHPHAYARDAVVGPGCEISESSEGRRAADPEAMHNRMACACSPSLSGLSPCNPHSPVMYHGDASGESWGTLTARSSPQPSHAGAMLGSPPMPCRPQEVPLRRLPCSPLTALTTFSVPLVSHHKNRHSLFLSLYPRAPYRSKSRPTSHWGDSGGYLQ
ncbi:hypothetical protein V8C26DRAFT_86924 [Trichoderma gracile]